MTGMEWMLCGMVALIGGAIGGGMALAERRRDGRRLREEQRAKVAEAVCGPLDPVPTRAAAFAGLRMMRSVAEARRRRMAEGAFPSLHLDATPSLDPRG